jgi:hypothetical protein
MPSTCVVTLIHGTWAKHAAWTKIPSPLTEALANNLGRGLRLESFQWSGRNLHYARSQAATALKQHIRKCSERYPEANHFIIAHSHGGNVALYALRDQQVRTQVRGTVCLSTPFISCRRRELGEGGFTSIFGFLVVLGWISTSESPIVQFIPGIDWLKRESIATWPLAILMIVITLVFGFVFAKYIPFLSDLAETFRLPDLESGELLIVRAPGDEASSSLGATRVFSLLLGYVSQALGRVYRAGERLIEFDERLTWGKRFLIFITVFLVGLGAVLRWTDLDLLPTQRLALRSLLC